MSGASYIGWVGHQNLGDELMWRACRSRFSTVRWSHSDVSPPPGNLFRRRTIHSLATSLLDEMHSGRRLERLAHRMRNARARRGGSAAMLGGGTLINCSPDFLALYDAMRRQLNQPVPVFGSGVLDPAFWMQAFPSFRDQRREWVEAMSDLPVIGVRGPRSKLLLEEAGAHRVVVCGDPCVLIHRSISDVTPATGCIGVNCGVAHGGMWGRQEDCERELGIATAKLAQRGMCIKFLAAWPPDMQACCRVAQIAGLGNSRPVMLTVENYATELRACDAVVAFKLHVGVAASVLNIPSLLLEYRPKCRDYAESIGWERWTLRTDQLEADTVSCMVQAMVSSRRELAASLCDTLCTLKQRFEQYCETIAPLLADTVSTAEPNQPSALSAPDHG